MAESKYAYAAEKLTRAVFSLVGKGSLHSRLLDAFEELRGLRAEHLPNQGRLPGEELYDEFVRLKERVGLAGNDYGGEAAVEPAVTGLSEDEARELAETICSLAFGVRKAADTGGETGGLTDRG